jgi:hypothetical protein
MTADSSSFALGFQRLSAVPLVIFGCIWAGFGIVAFIQISHWGREYDRKMAMIASGKVQPQMLYVARIDRDADAGEWGIGLNRRRDQTRSTDNDEYGHVKNLGGLTLGAPVPAYRIDGKWFVPRLNSGGFNLGKWVFLAFGLAPPLLAAGVAILVSVRRRRLAIASAMAIETGSASQAAGAALPKAFSVSRLHFDQMPRDDQLFALFGFSDYSGLLQIDDDPARMTLRARPGRLPMRYIVPWMPLVMAAITAAPWIGIGFGVTGIGGAAFWGFVAFGWLGVLPVFFGILFAINKYFDGQPDYFDADFRQGALALPRERATLKASTIECFTALDRWYRSNSSWIHVAQIAVLSRGAQEGFDYYPLLWDRARRRFEWKTVDQLARGFGTRVRHVTLTLRESRQLPVGK